MVLHKWRQHLSKWHFRVYTVLGKQMLCETAPTTIKQATQQLKSSNAFIHVVNEEKQPKEVTIIEHCSGVFGSHRMPNVWKWARECERMWDKERMGQKKAKSWVDFFLSIIFFSLNLLYNYSDEMFSSIKGKYKKYGLSCIFYTIYSYMYFSVWWIEKRNAWREWENEGESHEKKCERCVESL